MRKKKEIIVIVLILVVTIFLAFMPMILSKKETNNDNEITETKELTINITIKGELKVEELNLKIPYGYSYGYIINKIELYLNKYSVISSDRTKRYYEDTTIIIESSDTNNMNSSIDNTGKININTASTDELVTLYGVGEKRAKAIIEYRKNKKIETFTELKELLGVSNEVIDIIKEKAFL